MGMASEDGMQGAKGALDKGMPCKIASKEMVYRAGFVAILGKPNSGKSTLLNALSEQKLSLVSHKANATRKRMNFIVPYSLSESERAQIIFVDTPGIHAQEKLLNKYMLNEALKAQNDSDLIVYVISVKDGLDSYVEFLKLQGVERGIDLAIESRMDKINQPVHSKTHSTKEPVESKMDSNQAVESKMDKTKQPHLIPHILAISKVDTVSNAYLLKRLQDYAPYASYYLDLVPISSTRGRDKSSSNLDLLLRCVAQSLPISPPLFDEDILTNEPMREIYKEAVREALFDNLSDEVPYESDIMIKKVEEGVMLEKIYAKVIVEKSSQKGIIIGKKGATIKRIGKDARVKIERLLGKKVYLGLSVEVHRGWSKKVENLKKVGYDFTL